MILKNSIQAQLHPFFVLALMIGHSLKMVMASSDSHGIDSSPRKSRVRHLQHHQRNASSMSSGSTGLGSKNSKSPNFSKDNFIGKGSSGTVSQDIFYRINSNGCEVNLENIHEVHGETSEANSVPIIRYDLGKNPVRFEIVLTNKNSRQSPSMSSMDFSLYSDGSDERMGQEALPVKSIEIPFESPTLANYLNQQGESLSKLQKLQLPYDLCVVLKQKMLEANYPPHILDELGLPFIGEPVLVAKKSFDSMRDKEVFEAELAAYKKLKAVMSNADRSPYILSLHAMVRKEESTELIMELMEEDLASYNKRHTATDHKKSLQEKKEDFLEKLNIMRQIFLGLIYIHSHKDEAGQSLIHGDIKPHNILLNPSSGESQGVQCKLGDLGYVQHEGMIPKGFRSLYTLWYRHPSVVLGGPEAASTKTDMFAAGCVMHEIITGQCLFGQKTKQNDLTTEAEFNLKHVRRVFELLGSPSAEESAYLKTLKSYEDFESEIPAAKAGDKSPELPIKLTGLAKKFGGFFNAKKGYSALVDLNKLYQSLLSINPSDIPSAEEAVKTIDRIILAVEK